MGRWMRRPPKSAHQLKGLQVVDFSPELKSLVSKNLLYVAIQTIYEVALIIVDWW